MEERRIAVKFAYDGTRYFGFQRQPGRETVEGCLMTALSKVSAIRSARDCGYRSSSRTDRGVSAMGNVISFRTAFPIASVCSAVNSEMEHIWTYSAIGVEESFNPRAARERWYRYYLPKSHQDLAKMRMIASRFEGVHDFSGYSRKDKRNPMRKIDSIAISEAGMFYALDFKAESFLWNMVRRIVWMINEGSAGRMPLDSIGPESPKKPVRVGLSPPEYLVLMDINCGVKFGIDARARIGILHMLEREMREVGMRLEFSEVLARSLG